MQHRVTPPCEHPTKNHTRQSGFTLLETLVTPVVFGFLMTGLVQGLRAGIGAWQRQTRTLTARSDLDAADRTLRTLIARMDPGGMSGRPATFKGTSHRLVFTTTLPQAADALATREADVTIAVDTNQLQLLWLAHYRNRIRPAPLPERTMLLHDVDHLEIAYWQEPKAGWLPEWSGSTLPKLIRIRVVFTRDSGRHGSEIIVAPMRDRWRL